MEDRANSTREGSAECNSYPSLVRRHRRVMYYSTFLILIYKDTQVFCIFERKKRTVQILAQEQGPCELRHSAVV